MADPVMSKRRRFKDYFFSYSWSELGAVSALRNTWVGFYVFFGVVGLLIDPFKNGPLSAFCFGAVANYPGYVVGMWSQRREDPKAIVGADLMVWQLGNLAKIFFVIGTVFASKEIFRG